MPGVVLLGVVIAGPFTHAVAAEDMASSSALNDIYSCAAIEDDDKRLACFDRAVKSVKSAEETGDLVAVDKSQVQTLQREAFGFNLPSLPKFRIPTLVRLQAAKNNISDTAPANIAEKPTGSSQVLEKTKTGEISKIMYTIAKIKKKANGKIVFYLENGQVWAQTNPKNIKIPRKIEGLKAEIKKAAMGTYFLRINGKGSAIRVQRTR